MLQNTLTRVRQARRDDSGFTLIELVIVILILGVLAGVVVFSVRGINDRGEVAACKTEIRTVETAVEAFYANTNDYPNAMTDLTTGDNQFLHSDPEYVALAAANDGTLVLTADAPAGCPAP